MSKEQDLFCDHAIITESKCDCGSRIQHVQFDICMNQKCQYYRVSSDCEHDD